MNNAQHQAIPASIESYHRNTQHQLWLVHRRKKCAVVNESGNVCGAVITEKDEKRFGGCEKCWQKK